VVNYVLELGLGERGARAFVQLKNSCRLVSRGATAQEDEGGVEFSSGYIFDFFGMHFENRVRWQFS